MTSQIFNFSLISSDLWSWILDLLLYVLERWEAVGTGWMLPELQQTKKISGYFASSNSGKGRRQEKGNFGWWNLIVIGYRSISKVQQKKIQDSPRSKSL